METNAFAHQKIRTKMLRQLYLKIANLNVYQ